MSGRRLPRRLWPENARPTAEEFATWSRGVFLAQLVPVLDRLFEAVERGERCLMANHDDLEVLVHARWHRALEDLACEPPGPIRDHIEQHDARIRAAIKGRSA